MQNLISFVLYLYSLPNQKFLEWSNVKAYADSKINLTTKLKFVLGKVENIVETRKCWLPVFSPFPTIFSKGLFFLVVKSWDK